MEDFLPTLIGAAVPAAIAFLAAARRFGKVEESVNGLASRVGQVEASLSGLTDDLKAHSKERQENFGQLMDRLHRTEVAIVDRVSRIEGLIEAQRQRPDARSS